MKALADTHVLIWWLANDPHLSSKARKFLSEAENVVYISAASAWEISIKNRAGKLNAQALMDRFEEIMVEEGFESLPICSDHAIRAGALPLHHSDPFDRMLVAQAQAEHLAVLSADAQFESYGIRRIW